MSQSSCKASVLVPAPCSLVGCRSGAWLEHLGRGMSSHGAYGAATGLAGSGQEGMGWGQGWGQAPMALVLAQVGRSTVPLSEASLLHRLLSPERFSA